MVGCTSNVIMAEFTGGKLDHKDHKNVEYFVPLIHINCRPLYLFQMLLSVVSNMTSSISVHV